MVDVYLGLGSNKGDSLKILCAAVDRLSEIFDSLRCSSLYRSRALYVTDQADFLNAVIAFKTEHSARKVLWICAAIENALGRTRLTLQPKGPRTLDLDILLYGDQILDEVDLMIPHPAMAEREFVLKPLLELNPNLTDPRNGQPFVCPQNQGVYLERKLWYTAFSQRNS